MSIELPVAYALGALTYYVGYRLYDKRRPQGSPWRPDVRRWWRQNEDLMAIERRKNDEINARDFANGQKSDVVKRVEPYTAFADQGERDTPPHTESDRHAPPVALRQPGSEGRDAATSGRYRTALVLDEQASLDIAEIRNADLVMRYFRHRAYVIKDRHGVPARWADPLEAEELLAASDVIFHRGEARPYWGVEE
jgi:hypothetical protein